ncbi:GDSL-like Lipase/Acylhydrolase family protein [Nocardioides alpinus]|uniref:GDSL-like Lipase/Acylhydrolase family protein n=1 Tax=Nocardioides alpinus TaxID=748909 RepID=A0A1I0W7V3_9ACTN|nr:GDSL-like Lipase/Acylhydrolase family protein [Nocardioides alpinus]
MAVVVAAVVAMVWAPVQAQAEGAPVRVLIVGDSVTHGADGDYTWRYFSWKGLEQTGASVDFVGPYSGTFAEDQTWGGSYAEPDFDSDHAARWGLAMVEPWWWPGPDAPLIGDLVAESQPDVIVEQLGVNDFAWLGLSSEDMLESVRRFVGEARAVKPDVDFVLGTIPQTWVRDVDAFNAALPDLAAELTTAESRVSSTPVADFTNGVDTYDPAHPTTLGQRKIARSVSVGLEALGIGRDVLAPHPLTPGAHDPVDPEPEPEPEVIPPEVIAPPVETVPDPLPEPEPQVEPQPEVQPQPDVEPQPEVQPAPEGVGTAPAPVEPPVAVAPPVVGPAPLLAPTAPRRVSAERVGTRTVVRWARATTADSYTVRCGRVSTRTEGRRAVLGSRSARCSVRSVNAAGASRWVRVRVARNADR